jgi:long-chain acyl-CoA synthetase
VSRGLGEEIAGAGAVVLVAGAAVIIDERDHVRQRIAAYKYPRRSTNSPSGPAGKILKRKIAVHS